MRAGTLDSRIALYRVVSTPTGTGGMAETEVLVTECWAAFRAPRGQEVIEAGQIVGQVDGIFKIRWLSGVTPGMRIRFDGQVWDMFHPAPIGGRNAFLELYARVLRREGANG